MDKSIADTRANLSKIIDELAQTGPVKITRHGKVVAAIVPVVSPGDYLANPEPPPDVKAVVIPKRLPDPDKLRNDQWMARQPVRAVPKKGK